jgi:hypothetical protein
VGLLLTYKLTGHLYLTYLRSNLLLSEVRDAFVSVMLLLDILFVYHLVFLGNNSGFMTSYLFLFRSKRVPIDLLQGFYR